MHCRRLPSLALEALAEDMMEILGLAAFALAVGAWVSALGWLGHLVGAAGIVLAITVLKSRRGRT